MKQILCLGVLLILFTGSSGCNFSIPRLTETPFSPVLPTATLPGNPSPTPHPVTATPSQSADGASLQALKNFTYVVESPDLKVTLKDGEYNGDKIHSRLIEPVAFGDLNGDGTRDAVVILATNTGGSGTFFDLVPLLNHQGAFSQVNYNYFGDRQVVKNLQIRDGRVVLDYLTQGLRDGLCCPSEHRLRSYILEVNGLHLASEQMLVNPTDQAIPLPDAILIDQPAPLAFITNPLHVTGRVSQVPPEKMLEYYVTDLNATLLDRGEVTLQGTPGGPGSFAIEFSLGSLPPGVIKVELVDSANGILRGRSMVDLLTP